MSEPRFELSGGVPIRAMTEDEVRRFVAFLESKAAEFWAHYWAGEKSGNRHPAFKWEAKRFEDAERALFRILDGLEPEEPRR